jgi:hypothetical protein
MKFFISHKKEDETSALLIAHELKKLGVPYYLDTLDSTVARSGKELTDHIKSNLNDCTEILVVISQQTKYSQWVPFEVGMAAQKDLPTATFLQDNTSLPDFLDYWPRLKQPSDIAKYVRVKRRVDFENSNYYQMNHYVETRSTDDFYTLLKAELK